MSRTKEVFTTSMVCHVWAQQNQYHGRNQGGTVYFEGETIYSYGTHFVMGHFVDSDTVLLNADSYSNTTSGHQSLVHSVVLGKTVIHMPDLTNLRPAITAAQNSNVTKAHRQRVAERIAACLRDFEEHPGSARWLLEFMGFRKPSNAWERIRDKVLKRRAANERAEQRRKERSYRADAVQLGKGRRPVALDPSKWRYEQELKHRAKHLYHVHRYAKKQGERTVKACWEVLKETREELARYRQNRARVKRRERALADLEAWKRGENVPIRYAYVNGYALLRLIKRSEGWTVETSQGATVPASHALRAFRLVRKCKERGVEWRANGETVRVGHFHLDRVSSTGEVKAGCHLINYDECERIAGQIAAWLAFDSIRA